MDNTWATPYFFKPIKFGFDMSIVAATKYYSGHSDVMGGSLAVNKKVFKHVQKANKVSGLRLSPDDAYLIIRGLRTLDVRLDRHQENTIKVANFLTKNKKILGFINCPISKESLFKNKYQGVTEFLSKKAGAQDNEVMLLYNKKLSVSPLTTHIPLSQVSNKINKLKIVKK